MGNAPARIAGNLLETARELLQFGHATTALTLLRAAAEIDPTAEGLERLRAEVALRVGLDVDNHVPVAHLTQQDTVDADTAILKALWLMTNQREAEARKLFEDVLAARQLLPDQPEAVR